MPAEPSDTGASTPLRHAPGRSPQHMTRTRRAGRTSCPDGTPDQGPPRSDDEPRPPRLLPRRHLEDAAMRHALDLARSDTLAAGLGARVGCVLVGDDGAIVDEGRSDRVGGTHAAVAALADAWAGAGSGHGTGSAPGLAGGTGTATADLPGEALPSGAVPSGVLPRGVTAVLTLEPCTDDSQGGSCVQALLDAGVRRVVVAQGSPSRSNPSGADLLREAGVEVVQADDATTEDAASINRSWSFGALARRPLVTWVVEGGPAGPNPDLDRLRSAVDTLVVSTWAVLAHDVSLAVLGPDGFPAARQPLRVVMGTRTLDTDLPVFDSPGRTLHFATRDPRTTLAAIYDLGGRHVLLAGGPALAAEFLRAGLVDEVVSHVDPQWTVDGVVGAADLGVGSLPEGTHLHDVRIVEGTAGRPRMRVTLVPGASPLCDGTWAGDAGRETS